MTITPPDIRMHTMSKIFVTTEPVPANDTRVGIYDLLRPLDSIFRAAVLGLIGGFSAPIQTQTLCSLEAGELWDLKFKRQFSKDLDTLKDMLPINTLSIANIAKNVFIKRNTLGTTGLSYAVWLAQDQHTPFVNWMSPNANASLDILTSYADLGRKYRNLSDIPDFGYKLHEEINSVIDVAYTQAITHSTTNPNISIAMWRQMLKEYLANAAWIITHDTAYVKEHIIEAILIDSFLADVLPGPLYEKASDKQISITPLVVAVLKYQWIPSNETQNKPKETEKEPVPYNEVSAESIDFV